VVLPRWAKSSCYNRSPLAGAALLLGEQVGWLELVFAALVVGIVAVGWRVGVVHR
jgi:hypothetical protein